MKTRKRSYIGLLLLFTCMMQEGSFDSIPMDLLGSLAPEKKTHNKITSSVSSSAKKDDKKTDTAKHSDTKKDASEDKKDSADSKDIISIPTIPSIPKEISYTPPSIKTAKVVAHHATADGSKDIATAADEKKSDDVTSTTGSNTENKEDLKSGVTDTVEVKSDKEDGAADKTELQDDKAEEKTKELPVAETKDGIEDSDKKLSKVEDDKEDEDHTDVAKEAEDKKKQDEKEHHIKEPNVLYQNPGFVDDGETVVFNFEETDLSNVASYMESIHKIKFVSEDILSTAKDAKGLSGHKITFRTNKVLTKRESWDLFLTFLHIAGLDVIPMAQAGFYKIVPFAKANSDTIPTYIGVSSDQLPDNDMIVRFVYFAQSVDPSKIQPILTKMQASSSKLEVFSELKALIFTDRACNIKSLMQIVTELDKASLPETLSVIRLKRANVDDVISLYKSLKPTSSSQQPQRAWVPGKKEATLEYFPQDVATFPDKRTNSLILLGPAKGVKRIEDFIEQYIDVPMDLDAPTIYTYQLQYTNASSIQQMLQSIVQYGSNTSAGQYGGVRNDVKYFGKMTIVAETQTNSLVINASKEDYEMLKPLIDELDIPQKQIGIEVLLVTVFDENNKQLGSQLSAPGGPHAPTKDQKVCQTFAQNIAAQTSALTGNVVTTSGGTQTNSPDFSIKSSLASLLGQVGTAGSLVLTFGKPIWSVFKILNTISSTHILANPFLVASNNTQASITIGTTRQIVTSETLDAQGRKTQGFSPSPANLKVQITPQINKGNIINLQINVTDTQFTLEGENSAVTDTKGVSTNASVANGEVLVLGGIMVENYTSTSNGVPFLENVPLLGWFFKNKTKKVNREHFMIFICPKLLDPVDNQGKFDKYTEKKMLEASKNIKLIDEVDWFTSQKDPIQKAFFKEDSTHSMRVLEGQDRGYKERKKTQKNKKSVVKKSNKKHIDHIAKNRSKAILKKQKNVKLNKETFVQPLSLDTDFIHTSDSVPHRTNSIRDVVQQEERLRV